MLVVGPPIPLPPDLPSRSVRSPATVCPGRCCWPPLARTLLARRFVDLRMPRTVLLPDIMRTCRRGALGLSHQVSSHRVLHPACVYPVVMLPGSAIGARVQARRGSRPTDTPTQPNEPDDNVMRYPHRKDRFVELEPGIARSAGRASATTS